MAREILTNLNSDLRHKIVQTGAPLLTEFLWHVIIDRWLDIRVQGEENLYTLAQSLHAGKSAIFACNDRSVLGGITVVNRLKNSLGGVLSPFDVVVAAKYEAGAEQDELGQLIQNFGRQNNYGTHFVIQSKRLVEARRKFGSRERLEEMITTTYQNILKTLHQKSGSLLIFWEGTRSKTGALTKARLSWQFIFGENETLDQDLLNHTLIMPITVIGAERIHDANNQIHLDELRNRTPIHVHFGKPVPANQVHELSQQNKVLPDDTVLSMIAALLPDIENKGPYAAEPYVSLGTALQNEDLPKSGTIYKPPKS